MADPIIMRGTKEDPIRLDAFQTIRNINWPAKKILVVDIEYNASHGGSMPQFPTIPIDSAFLPGSFNWFAVPNFKMVDGEVTAIAPIINSASSGTIVSQNSIWRETIRAGLYDFVMWQQARLDFTANTGVVTSYSGRGTLYFNLSKVAKFFTEEPRKFNLQVVFPSSPSDAINVQLRAASYKKKETFQVNPRESNDDLDPAWNFYGEAISSAAGTDGGIATDIDCDLSTLAVSIFPSLNGSQWT